jgi:hypothetical protein
MEVVEEQPEVQEEQEEVQGVGQEEVELQVALVVVVRCF